MRSRGCAIAHGDNSREAVALHKGDSALLIVEFVEWRSVHFSSLAIVHGS